MLTDIAKALELIINTVRREFTPDKKRQRLAKKLITIYHEISNVLLRGHEIINILKGNNTISYEVTMKTLLAQENALASLIQALNDTAISSSLDLHLPHFKELEVLIDFKGKDIKFFLNQLMSNNNSQEIINTWIDDSMNALSEEEKRSKIERHQCSEEEFRNLLRCSFSNNWKSLRESSILDFSEFKRSPMKPSRENAEVIVTILTTRQRIQEAEQVLNKISYLKEELRLFLLEKFKFEDTI